MIEWHTYRFVPRLPACASIRSKPYNVGVNLYLHFPLHKWNTTVANLSTIVPQGVAFRAPHERPPLFISLMPPSLGASMTVQTVVEAVNRCNSMTSSALQSDPAPTDSGTWGGGWSTVGSGDRPPGRRIRGGYTPIPSGSTVTRVWRGVVRECIFNQPVVNQTQDCGEERRFPRGHSTDLVH